MKLSGALKSCSSLGSSPLSLTNQPRGKRFSVYSVPLLSVQSLMTLGGIPIPNSNTLTQLLLAAKKCPNSCHITKSINISIPKTINITCIFKKLKVDLCMQIHIYRNS